MSKTFNIFQYCQLLHTRGRGTSLQGKINGAKKHEEICLERFKANYYCSSSLFFHPFSQTLKEAVYITMQKRNYIFFIKYTIAVNGCSTSNSWASINED